MKYWKDMNEEELEELRKKTEQFEAIPPKKGEPRINIPALIKYCRKYGKDPEELTKEELDQFFYRPQ